MPNLKLVVLTALGLALVGCAKQYDIVMGPQSTGENYVVVQYTNSGGMKLWDCRAEPDEATWDPTCVRVRMQNSARGEAADPVDR